MASRTSTRRKPPIAITPPDYDRLARLAETMATRSPDLADELNAELERVRIVPEERIGADVVRLGSTVRYRTDSGETRAVTLVLPGEADISAGRISVLTPIGIALIGLSEGQTIDWTARDGRSHSLTVEAVEQPAAAAPSDGDAASR